MKKLLSIILSITIILSFAVISSSSAFAAETDIASTSVRTFSISEQANIAFSDVDGYCYGYVGDADGDDTVSVMDATAIQLHCTDKERMTATVCKIADADGDGEISVMDATAIQMHLVETVKSDIIGHVLYTPYDNFDPMNDTYTELREYIFYNATKVDTMEYYLDNYFEEGDNSIYTTLGYDTFGGFIVITTTTYVSEVDTYVYTTLVLYEGSKEIQVYNRMYNDSETLYTAMGTATITSIDLETSTFLMDTFIESLESKYEYIDEAIIKESLPSYIMLTLSAGEELMTYDVVGTILDLVYDVQSLVKG